MLDCYICEKSLYMCTLLFLYVYFGGLPTGEVDKISNFVFLKVLMFLGEGLGGT
jgi:hypothetical protein